jgi:hypothetical protein
MQGLFSIIVPPLALLLELSSISVSIPHEVPPQSFLAQLGIEGTYHHDDPLLLPDQNDPETRGFCGLLGESYTWLEHPPEDESEDEEGGEYEDGEGEYGGEYGEYPGEGGPYGYGDPNGPYGDPNAGGGGGGGGNEGGGPARCSSW